MKGGLAMGSFACFLFLTHYEPFDGPAKCIRIYLSLLDVHVNRSPCHGKVASLEYHRGKHLSVLNPQSMEDNESTTMLLVHPVRLTPVAALRQVAGLVARTIVCHAVMGQTLQRGERFGLIKLGSTVELYLPTSLQPAIEVQQGQRVKGGITVLASVQTATETPSPAKATTTTSMPDKQTPSSSTSQKQAPEPAGL